MVNKIGFDLVKLSQLPAADAERFVREIADGFLPEVEILDILAKIGKIRSAKLDTKALPNLATLSTADAEAWIRANTGNSSDTREVVVEMGKLLLYIRDLVMTNGFSETIKKGPP